jgi:glycosyltransferase involved in cell wall biosynthesis
VSAPRIVVVSPYRREYGPQRVLEHVSMALRAAGYAPVVVVPTGTPMTSILQEHVDDVVEIDELTTFPRTYNVFRLGTFLRAHLDAARQIEEVARTREARAVYSISEAIFCAGLAARRARVPSITHAIGMSIQSPAWGAHLYIRLLAHLTDRFIACSSAVAAMFAQYGVDDEICTVVHNGISVREIETAGGGTSPVDHPGPRVGIVAAFDPRKGHELFVAAAAAIVQSFPETRFFIIGGALEAHRESVEFEHRIRGQIDELGLADHFELTGYVRPPEVYDWIRAMDVIVVPSRTEAFAHALLEAMVCERAVVATRIEGNLDAFADGHSGRYTDSTAEGLATVVCELLADPDGARELGRRAADRARRYFDLDVTIPANAHAVRQLIEPAPVG